MAPSYYSQRTAFASPPSAFFTVLITILRMGMEFWRGELMPRDNLSVSPLHVRFLHSVAVTQSLSLAFAYVTRYITTTADSGRLYPYIYCTVKQKTVPLLFFSHVWFPLTDFYHFFSPFQSRMIGAYIRYKIYRRTLIATLHYLRNKLCGRPPQLPRPLQVGL